LVTSINMPSVTGLVYDKHKNDREHTRKDIERNK
jgi:hypothetical protein